ncbi:MAG: hypothetical protein ACTHKP_15780 [Nitrososphaeraceae archaeon]
MNIDKNNRNKIVGLAVVTILLITAMTVTTLNQTVFAHEHHSNHSDNNGKHTQSLAQANSSGNGVLPVKVLSPNSASPVQGKYNKVNVPGHQP